MLILALVLSPGLGPGTMPHPARADGNHLGGTHLAASFVRYAETDPLCCPSKGNTCVSHRVDRTDGGLVLLPER
jgi:hypothetical protein